jgi:UDP-N-acetylmuramoylalanine--D-glutamate ligase
MLALPFSPTAHIAILGLGKEGFSSYHFLKKNGYQNLTLLDTRNAELFGTEEQAILEKEMCILGKDYLKNIESYDIIIKTPGISPYDEKLIPVRDKIWSQARIFSALYSGHIIAVTGTKGKSTTTSLIYKVLKDAGFSVGLVGNIGNPVLDALEENYDYVVFEMSSYMLEDAHINPAIAVIVNIYPEHLDYHHGFTNYQNAKCKIIGKKSLLVAEKHLE